MVEKLFLSFISTVDLLCRILRGAVKGGRKIGCCSCNLNAVKFPSATLKYCPVPRLWIIRSIAVNGAMPQIHKEVCEIQDKVHNITRKHNQNAQNYTILEFTKDAGTTNHCFSSVPFKCCFWAWAIDDGKACLVVCNVDFLWEEWWDVWMINPAIL